MCGTHDHGRPVAYMARSRAYYQAQGFERAYEWAHHGEAPFAPPGMPLSACTVGLVTTASLYPRAPLEPRRIESAPMNPPPARLYTADLSWDKQATHTDDLNSFCPLEPLRALAEEGFIGRLAPRFHCAPTEYSHRMTREQDAPEILQRLRDDAADIALLVPL